MTRAIDEAVDVEVGGRKDEGVGRMLVMSRRGSVVVV